MASLQPLKADDRVVLFRRGWTNFDITKFPAKKMDGCMNIYVGNLAFSVPENELQSVFEKHGKVDSARIITDNHTGNSKGFGFVEMPNDNEAKSAMAELNGKELSGRSITVNEARPRTENRDRDRGDRGGDRGERGGGNRNRRW